MIEAFERHLNTIDITRKFEKAKTNDERVAICKEFLEKQDFVVKPKFEFNVERHDLPHIGAVGAPAHETWVSPISNNTYSRPTGGSGSSSTIQAKGAKVLQAQQIVPNDMLNNFAYGDMPGHIKDKLLSQMLQEIMDHAVFMIERQHHDLSVRAKLKLGVFKP